jgi:hypothetical protein
MLESDYANSLPGDLNHSSGMTHLHDRVLPGKRVAPTRVYTTLAYLFAAEDMIFYRARSQTSDVGSIPIARSISLDDSIAFTRLSR